MLPIIPFGDQPSAAAIPASLVSTIANGARLTKSFSGAPTDGKKWTISVWLKRTKLSATGGAHQNIWHVSTTRLLFSNPDEGMVGLIDPGNYLLSPASTAQKFTDLTAFHHYVWAYDSTQSTLSDRFKFWLDNTLVTDGNVRPNLNELSSWGSQTNTHSICSHTNATERLDALLHRFAFVDGAALDPTYFGQLVGGAWKPLDYPGPWGNNGFYLTFADANALGADASGRGNHWTAVAITSSNQSLVVP